MTQAKLRSPAQAERDMASMGTPAASDGGASHQADQLSQTRKQRVAHRLRRAGREVRVFLGYIGPGIIVSVAAIDPGNYSTVVSAGQALAYKPLFVAITASVMAFLVNSLSYRLGLVTGQNLARNCRLAYPRWLRYLLYVATELSTISMALSEVAGSAVAMKLLFNIPYAAGACLTLVEAFLSVLLYRPHRGMRAVRIYEAVICSITLTVAICFIIIVAQIDQPPLKQVFMGFLPSKDLFGPGKVMNTVAIIGATVSPFSIFLGSGLVVERMRHMDSAKGHYDVHAGKELEFRDYRPSLGSVLYSLRITPWELLMATFSVGFLVNCLGIILSASMFKNGANAEYDSADLESVYELFHVTLGIGGAKIFAVSLLLSGFVSSYIVTISGQMVMDGFLELQLKPWVRRIVARLIVMVPTLVIAVCLGRKGLRDALIYTQVVTSFLLPFTAVPLVHLNFSKKVMFIRTDDKDADSVEGSGLVEHNGAAAPGTPDLSDATEPLTSGPRGVVMRIHWAILFSASACVMFILGLNLATVVDTITQAVRAKRAHPAN